MKRTQVAVAAGLLVIFCAAGAAWACTQQPTIELLPRIGPPGSVASVNADGFSGPVEIRWNDASGPVIGRSDDSRSPIEVTIPADAAADVHYIVAVQLGGQPAESSFAAKGAAIFEVSGSTKGQSAPESNLWSGFEAGSGSTDGAMSHPGESPLSAGSFVGGALLAAGASVLAASVALLARDRKRARTQS